MYKVLPIKYPTIAPYQGIATLLSIIETDTRSIGWICNNFNQLLYFRKKSYECSLGTFFEQNTRGYSYTFTELPLLQTCILKKDVLNVKWETFTEFVKDCINLGYYIRVFDSCSFIPS